MSNFPKTALKWQPSDISQLVVRRYRFYRSLQRCCTSRTKSSRRSRVNVLRVCQQKVRIYIKFQAGDRRAAMTHKTRAYRRLSRCLTYQMFAIDPNRSYRNDKETGVIQTVNSKTSKTTTTK